MMKLKIKVWAMPLLALGLTLISAGTPSKLTFFVIGDWGRNGEYFQIPVAESMADLAKKQKTAFVINTGDAFYPNGVQSVNDPLWKYAFEDIYKQHSLQCEWYGVLGNHDYYGNPQAQLDYSKVSRRWRMPSRYYTFAKDNVRFVFIDSNPFIEKYQAHKKGYSDLGKQNVSKQWRWIERTLAKSKEKWKVVVGHHPVYSAGMHGDNPELIKRLKPILEKYKVDAYFAGHDHDLQHHMENGVNYFVSGAGSEVRDIVNRTPRTQYAEKVAGFAKVDVTNDSMVIKFYGINRNVLHSTKLVK
jgi:predicted phosphodiesterase